MFSRRRWYRLTFLKVLRKQTSLSDSKMIGVFTSKIIFHPSNLRRTRGQIKYILNNDGKCRETSHARLSHVFMRLVVIRRRSRFQQRLQLLSIRNRRRRVEAYYFFFHLQKIRRRRKVAWVLEKPKVWCEDMVLNQYTNNIWREHFRISRQTFQFLGSLNGY